MFGVNLAKIRLMVWSLELKVSKICTFCNCQIVMDLKAVSHTFDQNRLSSFVMYKLIFKEFLGQSSI